MNVTAVVDALQADGVGLDLSVRAKGKLTDEYRALIRDHRDDLITLLASRHLSDADYYLKIATSSGKAYVMAKPHQLREAVELYPWGVVSDSENRLITTWGDVPNSALHNLRDLATGELLIPEAVAA